MKRAIALVGFLAGILVAGAQGIEGNIYYQTALGGGKFVPIYGMDPLNPTYQVQGNNRALYAGREPVYGVEYWAELWAGPTSATEAGLVAVPGSRVHFRDDVSAIRGVRNLYIPGTLGGDDVTLQLRVWAATSLGGQAMESWDRVLNTADAPRGWSPLTHVIMGNVSADRKLYLPSNLAFSLEGFGLFIVPEPEPLALLPLLAALAFVLMPNRPVRSSARTNHLS